MICMTPGYGRAPPEAAHIWPTSGSLLGNLRPFRRNYQRGGFAVLSVTAAELLGCEPGIESGALREVRMQTCSAMRPFSMTTIWSAPLNGGEPMSNHDGGALVRDTIERLPPQSFALGVARGSRLIK
jgi:hypothetical protein